jgi:hypothetical protein
MTFTFPEKTFKKIKQGDKDFYMNDGVKLVPRACIEVSEDCSPYMKTIIAEASRRGWLKSVAYMKESEYVWEVIGK